MAGAPNAVEKNDFQKYEQQQVSYDGHGGTGGSAHEAGRRDRIDVRAYRSRWCAGYDRRRLDVCFHTIRSYLGEKWRLACAGRKRELTGSRKRNRSAPGASA